MNKAQIAIIATELGIFAIAVLAFWAFAVGIVIRSIKKKTNK
ncbi:MAG TPA: hypothetical protein OIM20_06600 [Eggerthellaceae bacterium]|nr:hypothetical protein [Eggerthellaceae bacterium]